MVEVQRFQQVQAVQGQMMWEEEQGHWVICPEKRYDSRAGEAELAEKRRLRPRKTQENRKKQQLVKGDQESMTLIRKDCHLELREKKDETKAIQAKVIKQTKKESRKTKSILLNCLLLTTFLLAPIPPKDSV